MQQSLTPYLSPQPGKWPGTTHFQLTNIENFSNVTNEPYSNVIYIKGIELKRIYVHKKLYVSYNEPFTTLIKCLKD